MRPSKKIKRLINKSRVEISSKADDKILHDAFSELNKQVETRTVSIKVNTRRTIMKTKIAKLTAAAMIVLVVIVATYFLGGSVETVAWADVLENICNSKTLTFLIRVEEQGPPAMKVMIIDPYLKRVEFLIDIADSPVSDRPIWIIDESQGKALILNTVKKIAKLCPAEKTNLEIYDAFRNFRDLAGFSVEEIGTRHIGDRQVVGFKLKKENQDEQIIVEEINVWADPETKLPILMEGTLETAKGQIMRQVITDIVFDADLDRSLFSLEPPGEYELEAFNADDYANRLKSAVKMGQILKACRRYVDEHDGQWPNNLQQLSNYGLDKDVFINPKYPEREVGYVYLKPSAPPSDSRIVLYEIHDEWNNGINVGLANYQVQFIEKESEFKKSLGKND